MIECSLCHSMVDESDGEWQGEPFKSDFICNDCLEEDFAYRPEKDQIEILEDILKGEY